MFLKIAQNSQESTIVGVSFLTKLLNRTRQRYYKENLAQCFLWILRNFYLLASYLFLNICSVEHLQAVFYECEWNTGWNPCISYPCVLDWWRMALRPISIYMKRVRKKTNVYRVSISKQIIITALWSSYNQTRKFILKPYSNQK